jgi:hypothetical protein
MKTNSQPQLSFIKGLMTLMIVLCTILSTTDVLAQRKGFNRSNNRSNIYLGFGGSFGIRSQKVTNSNFEEINNMPIVQEGGSGSVVFGKRAVRMKAEAGFYFSSANMMHTTDLVELATSANIYPLEIINSSDNLIEPYLTAGISRSKQKFYGYYHMDETQAVNYSVTIEPFVGNQINTQATFGTGVEFHLRDDHSFVHIFAEAKYSKSIGAKTTELMATTGLSDQFMINLGIVFGRHF